MTAPSAAIAGTTSISSEGKQRRDRCHRSGAHVERKRIESVPAQQAPMHLDHLAEQHVQREADRQVQHNADDRCGDCGQRAGQTFIAAKLFDERRASEDP